MTASMSMPLSVNEDDGSTHYNASTPAIYFYRKNHNVYGHLSNFYPATIYLDDEQWPTTEHYFQAAKFPNNPQYQTEIRNCTTAGKAATKGRSRAHPLRADWEQVKEEIMERAVMAKYMQHKELAAQLLATGDALLVEHTRNDRYWADGGGDDGAGLNRLGVILMRVRTRLLATSNHKP
jgi:ribA/ribD-fused uncharacterized protein